MCICFVIQITNQQLQTQGKIGEVCAAAGGGGGGGGGGTAPESQEKGEARSAFEAADGCPMLQEPMTHLQHSQT